MTAPIRDMNGLVDALREAKIERDISCALLDDLSGLPDGYSTKLLGPGQIKGIGKTSLGPLLGALGKALVLVDDAELLPKVQKRWVKRVIKGGAVVQMKRHLQDNSALLAPALSSEEKRREYMRQLGSKGGKMGGSKGGKRRLKTMSKRARQRAATHAARMRWAQRNAEKSGSTP